VVLVSRETELDTSLPRGSVNLGAVEEVRLGTVEEVLPDSDLLLDSDLEDQSDNFGLNHDLDEDHNHGADHKHGEHDDHHDHAHGDHEDHGHGHAHHTADHFTQLAASTTSLPEAPPGNLGLSVTTSGLDGGTRNFVKVNNDMAFRMYRALLEENSEESFTFSPLSASSSLALIFLGARSSTSWQINELLKLDEMIAFNPHLLYKNITDTLLTDKRAATCASTKHVLVSKNKESLQSFYKARASYFYGSEVDSVNFSEIQQEVSSRVNNKASSQTAGRVPSLVTAEDRARMDVESPLAVIAGNYFHGEFSEPPAETSLNYINLPRGRRLVPVDAHSWVGTFNAGYEPQLDCTAVEVPYQGGELSLVLLLPGRTSDFLAGGLQQLEGRIDSDSWERLLGSFVSQSLDLAVPNLSAHSVVDLAPALQSLGIRDAFSSEADFSGLNGARDLRLSSFLQVNTFTTVKDQVRQRRQAPESWPARVAQVQEDWPGTVARVDRVINLLRRRNRQTTTYKLHFERQFMYAVRHNPTGLVVHLGRFHQPHSHHHPDS